MSKENSTEEKPKQLSNNLLFSSLQQFDELEAFIETRVKARLKEKAQASLSNDAYESMQTDELCSALSKAQSEFPVIKTNRVNNFLFNQYADLDSIIHAIRPALTKNGLSITQQTKIEDEKTILVSRLRHESSQFIETRARIIPSKNDLQTYASALKAMMRHSIMALTNVTIQDDFDDDDGEYDMKEVRKERNKGTDLNTRYSAKKESFQTLTQFEHSELQYMLSNYPDIAEQMLDSLKVQALADIPRSKYEGVRDQAQKIINAREGKNK